LMSSLQSSAPAGDADTPKAVNLDKMNTSADEDDPFVSADGSALYYASNTAGSFDIFVSVRKGTAPWPAGKPVVAINTKDADERGPFLSRDGKLYFASNRIPDEKFKDLKNFDLKVVVGTRAPLMIPGISEREDELHPWVTASGKEFYFSRKTKDGWQLVVANGPTPGPIGDAKLAGLPTGFHHATISANGLTMYVQGPIDKNRSGLFRSTRGKLGSAWSKPEPLARLNHVEGARGDLSPCLSADGPALFRVGSPRRQGRTRLVGRAGVAAQDEVTSCG